MFFLFHGFPKTLKLWDSIVVGRIRQIVEAVGSVSDEFGQGAVELAELLHAGRPGVGIPRSNPLFDRIDKHADETEETF